ncbi:MAG: HAD-IIB family hydrolase [Spirochaetaceae bacterium]|jgi:HAD superfamily hydrolase (TIGR01484 family)|nr:HAD-IIB family hydrolase [Spirochaetaceae bacterium]
MTPISEISEETASSIRWVLTDIDDTLTKDGKLLPEAYAALWDLKKAGLPVLAVTGRAAAWGCLLSHEWPVAGVITENGAVAYYMTEEQRIESTVFPGAQPNTSLPLRRAAERILAELPRAREAQDNFLRLYDFAIDYGEAVNPPLSIDDISRIVEIFKEEGCSAQPSSIHVNAWLGDFNKREASLLFLSRFMGYDDAQNREQVLYVGDALNDEPMFSWFPNSCAVANIERWLRDIKRLPAWVSKESYGTGFAEIIGTVLSKRNPPTV